MGVVRQRGADDHGLRGFRRQLDWIAQSGSAGGKGQARVTAECCLLNHARACCETVVGDPYCDGTRRQRLLVWLIREAQYQAGTALGRGSR